MEIWPKATLALSLIYLTGSLRRLNIQRHVDDLCDYCYLVTLHSIPLQLVFFPKRR